MTCFRNRLRYLQASKMRVIRRKKGGAFVSKKLGRLVLYQSFLSMMFSFCLFGIFLRMKKEKKEEKNIPSRSMEWRSTIIIFQNTFLSHSRRKMVLSECTICECCIIISISVFSFYFNHFFYNRKKSVLRCLNQYKMTI